MSANFIRAGTGRTSVDANARPWILFGLFWIVALFGLLGAWGATAPISGAVIAQGVVTVDGKRKLIQHLEGGIVQHLLVQDGDIVAPGQALIRLDPTRARANLAILESSLSKELASEARLIAERDGSDSIAFPPELLAKADSAEIASVMQSQTAIFRARRSELKGEVEILEQRIHQLAEESKGLEAQREAKEVQIKLIAEELEGLKELLDRGQTTKPRVLALERAAAALKGEEGELIASIARSKNTVGETKLEIIQREKTFQKAVTEELQKAQSQLRDLQERAISARDTLARIEIAAPVGGTVVGMMAHTVGAVIKPGETIMEIVPGANNLIVEVAIRPQDIDNVSPGQSAALRILAFKQRTAPFIEGQVSYVSADSLENKTTKQQYYAAYIVVADEEIGRLEGLKLQPGMQAEVMIKTGDRTAFQYMLQPILDSMNRAFREE